MTKIICATLLSFSLLMTTCSTEVDYENLVYPTGDNVKAYPNPFISFVNLNVQIHKPSKVILSVSDKKGKLIKYVNAALDSGYYQYRIDFTNQGDGLFICEALIDDKIERINLYHTN